MAAPDTDSRQPVLSLGSVSSGLSTDAHPLALARIRPTQLGLWSFAVAIAHGAGPMLAPIYLWLAEVSDFDKSHEAAGTPANANLAMAVLVSVVHAAAMVAAGGCRGVGWFNRYSGLESRIAELVQSRYVPWAVSLILVGAIALVFGLTNSCAETVGSQRDGGT